MLQLLVNWITNRRGLALFIGAVFSRVFFILLVYLTALAATRINPQESFVYRRSEIFRGPTDEVLDIEFRNDGNWLAAASKDGNIFLWDFVNQFDSRREQGLARIILPIQTGVANDIIFTHDNRYLVSGGTDDRIRIWDVSGLSNQSVEKYKAYIEQVDQSEPFLRPQNIDLHNADVLRLALSDDGHYLASADQAGIVYLFDLRTGSVEAMVNSATRLDAHEVPITDITFSPSTHWLAVSDVSGLITVWDLTLLETDPSRFTTPAKRIETRSRVRDLEFDLAFKAPNRQPERYLFSVGTDKRVRAWSLRGENDTVLPDLHKSGTVKLGITRDNETNQYWLISADQGGTIIFWDMNQWEGLPNATEGDGVYIIQTPRREITAMATSLQANVPDGANGKNRHLLVTGSADRTAQVFMFSAARGQQTPVLLRPVSGRINDVAISPDHQNIITVGKDNTIRLWETSRVTDVSLAFPTQQFMRFLVPILLALVLSLHATSSFIMRTHNIVKRENAITYILTALFGLNFTNPGLFLLSLLVPIWPKLVIEKGKTLTDPDKFYAMEVIGGPGKVVIRPGNVVSFQTIRTRTAIQTNNTYYMRPFERIRKIISLEDQFHEYPQIETYTRDGIKITLKNVRIRYRVIFRENESNGQRLRARYQDYPDPIDPKQLDRALEMLAWSEAVQAVIRTRVIHFVNMRPLDYFTAPKTMQQNESVRNEFKATVERQTKAVLNSFGTELFWMDVGVFEIDQSAISTARMNLWSWQLRKEADQLRAKGLSQLEAYREMGRIRGEAEIVKAIIEEISRWDQETRPEPNHEPLAFSLTGKSGEKAEHHGTRSRAAFLARLAELLRSYLRIASSERGIFPTPWTGDADPSKKPPVK